MVSLCATKLPYTVSWVAKLKHLLVKERAMYQARHGNPSKWPAHKGGQGWHQEMQHLVCVCWGVLNW